jgi:predicted nucleic acid-binding protein
LIASSDSGPLIWLGKCDLLNLLRELYPEIAIPEAVYKEAVTRGLEKGFENAQTIKKALEEGWIRVYNVGKQFKDTVRKVEIQLGIEIGEGERETIALAVEKRISIFLTNDEDAYLVGKILGLKPKGVLYVILKSVKDAHLGKEKAKEALKRILEEGFWLSPTIIHKFLETLDRL